MTVNLIFGGVMCPGWKDRRSSEQEAGSSAQRIKEAKRRKEIKPKLKVLEDGRRCGGGSKGLFNAQK